jgi:hypothetical protein
MKNRDLDNELLKILESMARKIAKEKKREEGVKGVAEFDIIGIDSPHGIYMYDPGRDKWVLLRIEGEAFKPRTDGFHIIYFDNTKCPACRIYDLAWFPYVKLFGSKLESTYFYIILCDWFARECRSEAARKSFIEYNIHASPTTVLLYVENGKIKEKTSFEGSKPLDKLMEIIEEFIKKVKSRK